MSEISTGFLAEDLGRVANAPLPKHNYVFSPDSSIQSRYSRPIILGEGSLYLFKAYGLGDEDRIYVNSVSRGSPRSYDRVMLEGPDPGVDLYVQRMTLGGEASWVFSPARPQLLVNLPGLYRFELGDDSMIGSNICLEYLAIRVVPGLPPGVIG